MNHIVITRWMWKRPWGFTTATTTHHRWLNGQWVVSLDWSHL
jgi:hypothetical protein